MATLVNDRNELLYSAASRITGAAVVISAGVASSLVVPRNAVVTTPSFLTLQANTTGYITPVFTWSYRFSDSGTFTAITGTTNTITFACDAQFLTLAGTNTLVQFKVDVTETAGNVGVNGSSYTLSIPILREGVEGTNGINSIVVVLYKRTSVNAAPALDYSPSSNSTYTFTTGQVVGQPTGWTQTIPAATSGQYLWATQVLAASTTGSYSFSNGQWSTPVLYSQDGTSGTNTAVVYAYQRSTTALTTSPGAVEVKFSTSSAASISTTPLANSWYSTIPTGTDPLYVTAATAISKEATDTILSTEWSTPVASTTAAAINATTIYLYSRNNNSSTAPTLSTTGSVIYNFLSGTISGTIPANWSTTLPSDSLGSVIWVIQATAANTTTSTTVQNIGWGTPRVFSQPGSVNYPGASGVNGTNALSAILSNENHIFTSSSGGTVTTFAGSGTQIRMYDGATELQYDATSTANGTWRVSQASTNITCGDINDSGIYATVLDHSIMSASNNSASILYTITGINLSGVPFTITKTQTFSKSKNGASGPTGTRGSRQLYSNDTLYTSTYVFLTNAAGAASYAAKATTLIAAATTGTFPTLPITGDTVTFTNGTTYVYTITHDGTNWVTPGTVIDGNLLVTGSVTAAKINASGLSIKDSTGLTILDAGNKTIDTTLSMNAVTGAGFRAGDLTWDASGVRTSGKGVAMTPGGLIGHNGTDSTFSIDSTTGSATFSGLLQAANGTFAGELRAVKGNFSGSLNGADITGATGTFSGKLSAGTVDFASSVGITNTYTSVGTFTLTVPAGITRMRLTVYGGGGGGAGGGVRGAGGGGGGKQAVAATTVVTVSPGQQFTLTVGSGGAGGAGYDAPYSVAYPSAGQQTYVSGVIASAGGAGGSLSYYDSGYNGFFTIGQNGFGPNGGVGGTSNVVNGGAGGIYGSGGGGGAGSFATRGDQPGPSSGGAGGPGWAVVEYFDPAGVVLKGPYETLKTELRAQGLTLS